MESRERDKAVRIDRVHGNVRNGTHRQAGAKIGPGGTCPVQGVDCHLDFAVAGSGIHGVGIGRRNTDGLNGRRSALSTFGEIGEIGTHWPASSRVCQTRIGSENTESADSKGPWPQSGTNCDAVPESIPYALMSRYCRRW